MLGNRKTRVVCFCKRRIYCFESGDFGHARKFRILINNILQSHFFGELQANRNSQLPSTESRAPGPFIRPFSVRDHIFGSCLQAPLSCILSLLRDSNWEIVPHRYGSHLTDIVDALFCCVGKRRCSEIPPHGGGEVYVARRILLCILQHFLEKIKILNQSV